LFAGKSPFGGGRAKVSFLMWFFSLVGNNLEESFFADGAFLF